VTFNSVLVLVDLPSGECIWTGQVSGSKVFEWTSSADNESLLMLDRKGNVLQVNINKDTIAAFLKGSKLANALNILNRLASVTAISGCGDIVLQRFKQLMATEDFQGAAELAANTPELRNRDTLNAFLSVNTQQGQKSPVLFYFKSIMTKAQLNEYESVSLAKLVLQQDREKGAALLTN